MWQFIQDSRDSILEDVKFEQVLNQDFIKKLTGNQAQQLEGPLVLSELSNALKTMKNNKTPSIDALTAEFFKVFWGQLKFMILRVANFCFHKGKLSVTMRQSIINCIPKSQSA